MSASRANQVVQKIALTRAPVSGSGMPTKSLSSHWKMRRLTMGSVPAGIESFPMNLTRINGSTGPPHVFLLYMPAPTSTNVPSAFRRVPGIGRGITNRNNIDDSLQTHPEIGEKHDPNLGKTPQRRLTIRTSRAIAVQKDTAKPRRPRSRFILSSKSGRKWRCFSVSSVSTHTPNPKAINALDDGFGDADYGRAKWPIRSGGWPQNNVAGRG